MFPGNCLSEFSLQSPKLVVSDKFSVSVLHRHLLSFSIISALVAFILTKFPVSALTKTKMIPARHLLDASVPPSLLDFTVQSLSSPSPLTEPRDSGVTKNRVRRLFTLAASNLI